MQNNGDWQMDNFEICRFTSGAFVPPLNLPMRWCLSHRCDLWQWTRGRLTVLILIINCITMRKKYQRHWWYWQGFPLLLSRGLFHLYLFLFFCFFHFIVICLFTYFSCYNFRSFHLLIHDSSLTYFLFCCVDIHVLILCHYSVVQYVIIKKQQYRNVYKDIKIYIFLCLPLQLESVYSSI